MCYYHEAMIKEKDSNVQYILNMQISLATLEAMAKNPPIIKSKSFKRVLQFIREEFPGLRFDLEGIAESEKVVLKTFIAEEKDNEA